MRFLVLASFILAIGCATLVAEGPSILSESEFAAATVNDRFVVCRVAVRAPCGLSLSHCGTEHERYECVTDAVIVDLALARK